MQILTTLGFFAVLFTLDLKEDGLQELCDV